MKRLLSFILILSLLSVLLTYPLNAEDKAVISVTSMIDPGFSSAVPIAESGSIVDLNINGVCQYYTFTHTAEDNFTAEVISTSSVKIKYELYDSDFSLMEEFTAPANDSYSSGWYPLPQGTYYIKVYPASGSIASGTLCINFATGETSLNDPGFASAEKLYVSGETIDLNLNGAAKYYTFFLQGDMEFGTEITSTSSGELKLELYDSQHNLVNECTVQANRSGRLEENLAWGTYYVKVYPVNSATASGKLCITSVAMEPKMTDHGFSSAFHVTDKDASYVFEGLFEYRYFAFDMTENGIADIYIENLSDGHLEYELYQGENTVLFRYDMSESKNYTYSPELQAGRYYIRVYTPWNHAFSGRINIYSEVLGDGTVPDVPESGSKLNAKLRVYEPTYEYIRQFKDDYATVYNNGVYSLVDAQNNHHYSTNQDGFGDYSEDIVAIYDADKHEITFTRLDGYSFAFIGYIWAGEFLGGKCAIVDEDGKYGLIDTSGNFIVECMYDDIEYDTSDTILLRTETGWTPYTIGQSSTYSLRSRAVVIVYNPVLSVTGEHIIASDGTAYGILTTDNIPLTAFEYDLIHDAEDGLFVGYRGDYVDLIEADGTVSATFTAYYVGGYSEGKFTVYDGTEFFYADKNGNRVVELSVEDVVSAEEFHESLAVICIDNKGYTYINTSGEIAVDSYWDYAAQFAEGYALVMNYITDGDGTMLRRWNVIDTEFNNVLTLEDDVYIDADDEHSADFSNGYIRTVDRNTGLMGFVQLDRTVSGNIEDIVGDVNGDGLVNEADVELLGQYFSGHNVEIIDVNALEIDGDGVLTRRDAMILARHVAGWKGYDTLPYHDKE